MRAPVCIILLSAAAAIDNGRYRAGDRHSILAYARGETFDEIQPALLESLTEHHWTDFEFEKIGTLPSDAEDGEGMITAALEDGVALTVYSDPITR
jgi:hypothetical protein